jgi:hypothetical protein
MRKQRDSPAVLNTQIIDKTTGQSKISRLMNFSHTYPTILTQKTLRALKAVTAVIFVHVHAYKFILIWAQGRILRYA